MKKIHDLRSRDHTEIKTKLVVEEGNYQEGKGVCAAPATGRGI
jgi:hypothetical protein